MHKNKTGRGDQEYRVGRVEILNRVVRAGFIEKVVFM